MHTSIHSGLSIQMDKEKDRLRLYQDVILIHINLQAMDDVLLPLSQHDRRHKFL